MAASSSPGEQQSTVRNGPGHFSTCRRRYSLYVAGGPQPRRQDAQDLTGHEGIITLLTNKSSLLTPAGTRWPAPSSPFLIAVRITGSNIDTFESTNRPTDKPMLNPAQTLQRSFGKGPESLMLTGHC